MKLVKINVIQGVEDNGRGIPHSTSYINFDKIDYVQEYRMQSRNGTYHAMSNIRVSGSNFQVDIPYTEIHAWVEEHSKPTRPNLRQGGNV